MRLEQISLLDCEVMAKQLAKVDAEDGQSTWIYDEAMHRNAEYFSIMQKNPIGFVVLKKGGFGEVLFWLSIEPSKRYGSAGALATYIALNYAFEKLKAKCILSDVFQDNTKSMKIHKAIFVKHDDKRIVNNKKVTTFVMTRNKFEANKEMYDRVGRALRDSNYI